MTIPDCMLVGTRYNNNRVISVVLEYIPYRLADIGMLTF